MIDEGIVVEKKDVSTDIIAMWQSIITWYGGFYYAEYWNISVDK